MDELDAQAHPPGLSGYATSGQAHRRRAYATPRVVEFGVLVDLTRGGLVGIEDFGFTGTTQSIVSPPPPPEEF